MGSTPYKWMTIFCTILLLISNAVTFRRDKSILYNRSVIISLAYCFFISLKILNFSFLAEGIGLFGGLFHITLTTQIFHIFVYIIALIIIQLTSFYPRKIYINKVDTIYYKLLYTIKYNNSNFLNKMGQQFKIVEYPLILLFTILGGLFLMSSSDIISIFLSIELQSYGLYILATLYKNSELSTSAGLTYFLLGGLSSSFILLGASLLYANSGTTCLDGYYIMTSISNTTDTYQDVILDMYNFSYLDLSFLIMSIGLLFKISAAPFHFWSPDVYDAIPTIVTTFVAIVAKISILALLLELVHYTNNFIFSYGFVWTSSLLLSSFLSFIIGTILGLSQSRIKRLFAYSTISHIAFILLALAINSIESIEAFIFYVLQYSLSNLNGFVILIAIGFSLYPLVYRSKTTYETDSGDLSERNNSPIQLISELKGFFNVNPFLALSLAITLFSFIGIPPLMGFFAKQMVLSSAISNGYIFLSIIAILTSVISASYYLNMIKEIFFEDSNLILNDHYVHKTYTYKFICKIVPYINIFNIKQLQSNFEIYNVTLSSFLSFTISFLTLLLLLFMFASQEWLRMTRLLSILIINT